jgi:hypothetical protein
MEKSQLDVNSCDTKFAPLGMSFSNNGMPLFMFLILKILIDLNNSLYLKVALLNLITILSTWVRVGDVMDTEVPFTAAPIIM